MASQETRQRKGGGPPKSADSIQPMTNVKSANSQSATTLVGATASHKPAPKLAVVKRNKYGTGPFDENWLNLDCCGLFCVAIHVAHVRGIRNLFGFDSTLDEYGRRIRCADNQFGGHVNRVAFTLIAVLAVCAHFKAMTTNPGAVPPDALPLEESNNTNQEKKMNLESNGDPKNSSLMVEDPPQQPPRKGRRLCRRCNSFKPKRAHHCSICKRCIVKMDHHCPWVNNCVGIGNHKYFLLFIFYTCVSCVYSLTLVTIRFFDCMGRHGHIRTHHPAQLLNILGLLVEAILFGLFTCCMMFDQAGVVTTNMTHIDRLKGSGSESGSPSLAGVIEVFGLNPKKIDLGGRFRADWLSPFHRTCFPSALQEEMMGFCKPCGSRRSNGNDEGDTEMSPMVRNNVADIV
eukprot:CAMPEP_0168281090 /NCGR_PEP_ID=MMETSP0141_2-20121125/21515_1 /TAXON_ID=44445 /ORGANISM="Pseudo-nitzschia australis, Strain 10249 10 AB" /LENGTH=401 /DNA_ID=CAMNT_0008224459 /DNA_START=19 /DNA_END=1228 /DNA_ORIENTATION=-